MGSIGLLLASSDFMESMDDACCAYPSPSLSLSFLPSSPLLPSSLLPFPSLPSPLLPSSLLPFSPHPHHFSAEVIPHSTVRQPYILKALARPLEKGVQQDHWWELLCLLKAVPSPHIEEICSLMGDPHIKVRIQIGLLSGVCIPMVTCHMREHDKRSAHSLLGKHTRWFRTQFPNWTHY